MLTYVLNQNGKPLMPCKSSKARRLLKQSKAKVVKLEPFTLQLLHGSSGYKQEITLGVDAGSKMIGLSATTENNELYSADIQLRNDVVDLLSTRRQNRRTRRNRLRYRKPRFLNRVKSKNKGWLAPSIENKIQTHLT
ncbi:MAG: HNH endonuclease, partial [Peptococcaceae bacterium BRH_c23]